MTDTATLHDGATPRAVEVPPAAATLPAAIRKLLFLSDLSPESDAALEHARFLAEHFDAALVLYHVVELPRARGKGPWDPQEEALRREAQRAREHLERHAENLRVPREIIVDQEASVRWSVVGQMRWSRPDLTVMAVRAHEGISLLFNGNSTMETVLQHGNRPVLCVREPEHGVALPYRRILVPTDLSPASRRAFPPAALLARRFGAEVVALHVAQVTAPRALSGVTEAVDHVASEADLQAFLGAEFAGIHVIPRVLLGSAWTRIVETARTERVDLIAISTHGRDSFSDRIVGSHAERVIGHSPCPVLVA